LVPCGACHIKKREPGVDKNKKSKDMCKGQGATGGKGGVFPFYDKGKKGTRSEGGHEVPEKAIASSTKMRGQDGHVDVEA